MKELSIQEKAQRYDKALEAIKSLQEVNPSDEGIQNWVKENFPELKESEDERIRKELICFLETEIPYCNARDKYIAWLEKKNARDKYIAWLEKQGEQKPQGKSALEVINEEKVDNANKVEPKFKVEKDKWYVCTSQYCNCIEGRNYKASLDGRIIDDYGTKYDIHSDAYRWFRPWTIQDAKDGDVLIDGNENFPFIFKQLKPCDIKTDIKNPLAVLGYCGIGGAGFTKGSGWGDTANCTYYPANKEQQNLLFQKMKEAGYEWDAEKKELNKVEQKEVIHKELTEFEKAVKQVMEEAIECGDIHNLKADADMLLNLIQKPDEEYNITGIHSKHAEGKLGEMIKNLINAKPRYSIGDVLCDKSCTTLYKDAQPNFEILDIRNGLYICDNGSIPISQQDEYELVAKKIEQKLPIEKLPSETKTIGESLGFTTQEECDKYNQMVTDLIMSDDDKGELKSAETVEWSPQEENYICQLESLVKEQWRKAKRIHNSVKIKKMSELLFFLKTLNPNKKSQKQWNPSDEQMKALSLAMCGVEDPLFSLYQDLEKLKG